MAMRMLCWHRLFRNLEKKKLNMNPNATLRAIVTIATALSAQQILQSQTLHYDVSYLNGGYTYNINGSAVDPNSGARIRSAETGRLTADGAGNVSGVDTVIVAEAAIRRT